MLSRSRLLRKARSNRRLHITIVDNDEVIPPMPTSPIEEAIAIHSRRNGAATVDAIPMPLPPTTASAVHMQQPAEQQQHHRQSSCASSSHISHFSRASSWSSASSTTSSSSHASSHATSRATNNHQHLAWDPLRLHPTTTIDCAPDASSSSSSSTSASYTYSGGDDDFDFGFGVPRYHTARNLITPVSSTDYDDDAFVQGLSAPPRKHLHHHQHHHRTLRTPSSEACLPRVRPTTPDLDSFSGAPSSASEPSSPIRPRMQPFAATETEHMLKRGDWKRRGIIFGLEN